jgi:hypothetical protein
MRNLIILFVIVALVSCKPKPWNKEYLLDKCKTEMGKDKEIKGTFSTDQQGQICDCSVDKILAKYKTKSEADKDKAGVEAIGAECATAVLMPPQNSMDTNTTTTDPGMDTTTTTTPADTTNH